MGARTDFKAAAGFFTTCICIRFMVMLLDLCEVHFHTNYLFKGGSSEMNTMFYFTEYA